MKIKLIVGLGNPGKEYENTRHNMGFRVLDEVAKNLDINKWKQRDGGLYFDSFVNFSHVIFLKPQKYINLSGEVVEKFVKFFDIKIEDILIISDDLDSPVGSLKIKEKGSSGGHNGLKNIEQNLKTNEYKRIKIGISNNREIDTKDYVLGKVSKKEQKILDEIIVKASDAVLDFVKIPYEQLISKYTIKVKE